MHSENPHTKKRQKTKKLWNSAFQFKLERKCCNRQNTETSQKLEKILKPRKATQFRKPRKPKQKSETCKDSENSENLENSDNSENQDIQKDMKIRSFCANPKNLKVNTFKSKCR